MPAALVLALGLVLVLMLVLVLVLVLGLGLGLDPAVRGQAPLAGPAPPTWACAPS